MKNEQKKLFLFRLDISANMCYNIYINKKEIIYFKQLHHLAPKKL